MFSGCYISSAAQRRHVLPLRAPAPARAGRTGGVFKPHSQLTGFALCLVKRLTSHSQRASFHESCRFSTPDRSGRADPFVCCEYHPTGFTAVWMDLSGRVAPPQSLQQYLSLRLLPLWFPLAAAAPFAPCDELGQAQGTESALMAASEYHRDIRHQVISRQVWRKPYSAEAATKPITLAASDNISGSRFIAVSSCAVERGAGHAGQWP